MLKHLTMNTYKTLPYAAAQRSFIEEMSFYEDRYRYNKKTFRNDHKRDYADEILDILTDYRDELTGVKEKKPLRDYLTSIIATAGDPSVRCRIPAIGMELWHAEIIEMATLIYGKRPPVDYPREKKRKPANS